MKIRVRLFLVLALLILLPLVASAQVKFTVTGQVKGSYTTAYQVGQLITMTFTLAPDSGSPSGYASATDYIWEQETAGQPLIFQDVTLTGATGAWASPVGANAESFIFAFSDGTFGLSGGVDTDVVGPSSSGLFVGGDAVKNVSPIGTVDWFPLTLPPFSDTLPDPNQYFAQLAGYTFNFTPESLSTNTSFIDTSAGSISFDALTVSVEVVPEPSTFALIAAGVALVALYVRRTRVAK